MSCRCDVIGDVRDRRPPEHLARRRDAERKAAPVRIGGEHPDGAGLPEQHAVRGGLGRRRARDRAAIAAEHQVDAGVAQLVHGCCRGVRAGRIDRFDLDLTAVHAAVVVRQIGGEHDAAVLVDASGPLRTREGVNGSDPDRRGIAVPGASDGDQDRREHGRGELPGHRSATANRFAAAWVAAGTVQVPDAHRCHENSRPAPRSTGKAASP